MRKFTVSRYENSGDVRFRDLIVKAADEHLGSRLDAGSDAGPMMFGHVIGLELAAFRATAREQYFRRAFALGENALERFFGGSPCPPEGSAGIDSLALALVDLHLTTRGITAVRAPVNTIDR